ncbi:MAG: CRISPR-associated protein Cas4 [Syntrophobacteraceae bacterium]
MYAEDDLLPISALQHLIFCPRQCALIHVEQIWAENRLTAEGRILHERVHSPSAQRKGSVRVESGLQIRSLRLGLSGTADVVEFHSPSPDDASGPEIPYPVEYKRGKPKKDDSDRVQLCAQALCLEEMLGVGVPAGAIFYGEPRRRLEVVFDEELRERTAGAARALHEMVAGGVTPVVPYEKKCRSCSLFDRCLPKVVRRSVGGYLDRMLAEAEDE